MSASLVGSEMCIRDSGTTTALNTPHGSNCGCQHPTARGCGIKPHQQAERCLLYTSDAADDM
eukprot:14692498-Alexandrium_andersonii.AAC.1